MAFTPLTLIRVGGNTGMKGPSLWLYQTADAITLVDDVDYFQACKFRGMSVADLVLVSKTTGAAYICYVNAIDSDGNATVSTGTVVA